MVTRPGPISSLRGTLIDNLQHPFRNDVSPRNQPPQTASAGWFRYRPV